MPHLFGPLGKTSIGGNLVRVMCLRKEFRLMSSDRSSPIADWIRLLCREVKDQRGVKRCRSHWYVPNGQLRNTAYWR